MQSFEGEEDRSLLGVNDRVRIPKITQQWAIMSKMYMPVEERVIIW